MDLTYYFILDLKEDEELIAEYDEWHTRVWPEVIQNIRETGITSMEIFRTGNRLMMRVQAGEDVNLEAIAGSGMLSQKTQDWEIMMWEYQQGLPFAAPGQKWVLMNKIFDMNEAF